MTKFYLTLLMAIAISAPGSAQRMLSLQDGVFSSELSEPTVKRSVTPIDGGYKVKYVFEKALLVPDDIYPETETVVYNGFVTNGSPEMPSFPYSSESFAIPTGFEADIVNVNEDVISIKSQPAPGRLPKFISDTTEYSAENVSPVNSNINGLYPSSSVIDNGWNEYNGIKIANIGIIPVRYDVASGDAIFCKSIEYDIIFSPAIMPTSLNSDTTNSELGAYFDDPFLSASTVNWEWEKEQYDLAVAASTNGVLNLTPKNYLIIAATSYKQQVEKFIDWKKTLGFNAKALYKNNWTPDEILSAIKGESNLSYLLLVGNNTQVPGKEIYFSGIGNVITDILYACPNYKNGNYVPEISCGRLPVNTADECATVINKIIDYEKNPVNLDAFYNTNLFMTVFQGNYHALTRNSQTTYEISKYVESQGKTIRREFYANSGNPQTWKDPGLDENGVMCDPCPVPSFLRKPIYPWNAGASDISAAINSGCSNVFYFGHGIDKQWNGPSFNTTNVSNLTNGAKLPVIFSMACMTGNYKNSGSLAEKFLTKGGGGAISVFGFTNTTAESYTDVMSLSIYNGLYPSPGLKPIITLEGNQAINFKGSAKAIIELGSLHKLALASIYQMFANINLAFIGDYLDAEAAMFTLFGDPSMNMYLEKPTQHKSIVSNNGSSYSISVPSPYVVTTYDKKTGINMNYSGTAIFNLPSDPSQFYICVHAPGKKPYIIEPSSIRKAAQNTSDENQLVREDRLWKYFSYGNLFMEPTSDIYVNLRFDGTTEIDGKTYYNCCVWQQGKEYNEENVALIAYMREENGDVFVRYIPDILLSTTVKGIYLLPYPVVFPFYSTEEEFYKYAEEEYLLYKPGLSVGESFFTTDDETVVNRKFEVSHKDEVECNGVYRDLLDYKSEYRIWYNYLEGIGSLYGFLPFANTQTRFLSDYEWDLIEVYDSTGLRIFSVEDSTLSIDRVQGDSEIEGTIYHTLQGLEVASPSAPGIYIKTTLFCNGTKKSEKIIIK
ncbi:MAG: C25 family cysteine peptidase [Muribaculum sp.]|nr:C25 family cysteine peptidase [Muribaculum sp.]